MTQQDQEVIHVDQAVVIEVGIRIIRTQGGQDIQHVVEIDEIVAGGVTCAAGACIHDEVAGLVGPVTINLVWRIATDGGVGQSVAGRNDTHDTASVLLGRVARDHGSGECGVADLGVDPAPNAGRHVARDRAVGDQLFGGKAAEVQEDGSTKDG